MDKHAGKSFFPENVNVRPGIETPPVVFQNDVKKYEQAA